MTKNAVETALQEEVKAWFRSLEPLRPEALTGLWKGAGMPSGHPLDGVLENLGWFGKRFHPDMRADALLFHWQPGVLVAIDPVFFPVSLAIKAARLGRSARARRLLSRVHRVIRAKGTTAAVMTHATQDGSTAAMVYDRQPIVDVFRRINDVEIAGMMEVRGDDRRFFFKLEPAQPPA
jgi:hypothetical protein